MEKAKAVLALIVIFGIFLRLLPIGPHVALFEEPDNYIYYLMANQTLHQGASNLTVPSINVLSGFPAHHAYTESKVLILTIVIAFRVFSLVGIDLVWTMHLLSLIMGVIGILVAYLFTSRLTKSRIIPLFAAFFYATIPAAVFKTSLLEFRGETFVPVLLGIAVLLYCNAKNNNDRKLYAASLIVLGVAVTIWSGGIYALCTFLLMAMAISIAPLLSQKRTMLLMVPLVITGWIIYTAASANLGGPNLFSISEVQPTTILLLLAVFYLTLLLAPIGAIALYLNESEGAQYRIAILSILLPSLILMMSESRLTALAALPISVVAAIGIEKLYEVADSGLISRALVGRLVAIAVMMGIVFPIYQFQTSAPAAFQTPGLFNALAFLRTHTPANATVLSMWDSGSMIEAVAGRTSATDSVTGLKMGPILNYSHFLFANAMNLTYLQQERPDFVFVRKIDIYYNYSIAGHFKETSINGTNLQLLLHGQNISTPTLALNVIYDNGNNIIYKTDILQQQANGTAAANSTPPAGSAYVKFITNGGYTLEITGPISPINLSNEEVALIPKGTYMLHTQTQRLALIGNSTIETSPYGDLLRLGGSTVIYENTT